MKENKSVDKYWEDNPLIIKEFIEKEKKYELLCQEIGYILKTELNKQKIDYSSVTFRRKTLKSFLEKIQRKNYNKPFEEITDLAGARIVFLYIKDFSRIERLIKKTFEVIEKVDKLNEKKLDQFGYGAIHFIVKLSPKYKGARYDDLKNLFCEIQVRTILQDAWAIVDHHLIYKSEDDVPVHLRRKLNSLAGLFETADDQFQAIKEERNEYIKDIKQISKTPLAFLDLGLNIDSFIEFLNWKYENYELMSFEGQPELIFKDIDKRRYKTLNDLNNVYLLSEKFYQKVKYKVDIEIKERKENIIWSKALDFALRLVIYDKDVRNKRGVPAEWVVILNKMGIKGYSKRPPKVDNRIE